MKRILVAVDDSAPGLAAARIAIELAAALGAALRAITVDSDGSIATRLHDATAAGRQHAAAEAVLRHVAGLADRAGVSHEQMAREGDIAKTIVAEARAYGADVIVLGRSDVNRPGEPYLGSNTRQVLEFADRPVLIAPAGRPA
jgi:nucleotide-binding universal stress UspA family protein